MTTQLDEAPAPAPAAVVGAGRAPGRPKAGRTGLALHGASGSTLGVVVLWLSLLVLLPLAAVVGKAFGDGGQAFWSAITNSVTVDALKLTIGLALVVAAINAVLGALVAWVLVRDPFPGSRVIELAIDLPFALPTIVAGVVMLTLYSDDSPVGVHLVGTRLGLFVALLFVTLPFTVRTVQPVLLDLDRDAEQAAASLGARPAAVFRRIVLPQILPATISGAVLAFARALGEYGSLVLISSNLPHKTLIAPSLIYGDLQDSDHPARATQQAAAISAVLLLASAVVLVLLEVVQRRVARRG